MKKGVNSDVLSVRLSNEDCKMIKRRADRNNMSVADYLKWILLRPHKKLT